MNRSSSTRLLACAAAAAAFLSLFAGCAATSHAPMTGSDGKIVVVEYDTVYVIGSHIPVLVPRSPTVRTLPTMSPTTILTPDDIRYGMGSIRPPMH